MCVYQQADTYTRTHTHTHTHTHSLSHTRATFIQVLTAEQQAAEAERIAKRKAKFGIVDAPAVDERKKARMEKFGTAPKGGGGGGGKGAAKAVAPVRELTAEEKAKIEARKARFN